MHDEPSATSPRKHNTPANAWGRLAALASRSSEPLSREAREPVPAGFVEAVLARRAFSPVAGVFRSRPEGERLVLYAAGMALAASLLVALWSWPALARAWGGSDPAWDTFVQVGPLE